MRFGSRIFLQYEPRHFRPAVVAQWFAAGQSPIHVKQRGNFVKQPAIVLATIGTGYKQRTEHGQADLSAVTMPAKHELHAVSPGPANVVGRVAQAEPEGAFGTAFQIGFGAKPRAFVPDDDQRLAAHVERAPAVAEHRDAELLQFAANA